MNIALRAMASTANVSVDCENITGELKHIWTSIAYDEINACYTERGQNLLKVLKGKSNPFPLICKIGMNKDFLELVFE